MSITFQTNVASMIAENNLSTNSAFQTQTITRLTSGYRINSSGDGTIPQEDDLVPAILQVQPASGILRAIPPRFEISRVWVRS